MDKCEFGLLECERDYPEQSECGEPGVYYSGEGMVLCSEHKKYCDCAKNVLKTGYDPQMELIVIAMAGNLANELRR